MMQEMGILPKPVLRDTKKLEKHEFKDLCRRGATERELDDPDRIGGVGYEPANTLGTETLRTIDDVPVGLDEELIPVESEPKHSDRNDKKKEKKHKKEKKKKDKKEKKHKKRERSRDRSNKHRSRHDSKERSPKRSRHDSD